MRHKTDNQKEPLIRMTDKAENLHGEKNPSFTNADELKSLADKDESGLEKEATKEPSERLRLLDPLNRSWDQKQLLGL